MRYCIRVLRTPYSVASFGPKHLHSSVGVRLYPRWLGGFRAECSISMFPLFVKPKAILAKILIIINCHCQNSRMDFSLPETGYGTTLSALLVHRRDRFRAKMTYIKL